ncbi:MAG: hypothetical protein HYY18_02270 [Planctomycetes bacterium]|nr:hypothetical protein [Planctomycetota bacterium]
MGTLPGSLAGVDPLDSSGPLKRGDILVSCNGEDAISAAAVEDLFRRGYSGHPLGVRALRSGELMEFELTRPPELCSLETVPAK